MNSFFNLQHLKFFCDSITYKSISEAAKMNYVTQSAISQAIGKLEKQLGVPLIFHNRQKLFVTVEGKILYENAKEIFQSVHKTCQRLNETKEVVSGTLRFTTTKSLGMSFLAPMYQKIRKDFPLVELKFKMGGLNLIRTKLKREEAEFAIVVYDDHFKEYQKIPIAKGRFNLYQSKESPSDLIEQGIFVDEFEGLYVKELEEFLSPKHSIKTETAGWELTARFTQLGIGVGFFPDYLVKNNRYCEIVKHPLELPPFEYEICAIHNKTNHLSRAARLFIETFSME